jgi:FtsZ-binding cell division protein ZapB
MSKHSHYEELCVESAVGQISPADLAELQEHLISCALCEKLQSDLIEVNAICLDKADRHNRDLIERGEDLRLKILRGLQQAGAKFSSSIQQELSGRAKRRTQWTFLLTSSNALRTAVATVLVCAIASLGLFSLRRDRTITAAKTNGVIAQTRGTAPAVVEGPPITLQTPAQPADSQLQEKLRESRNEITLLQLELKGLHETVGQLQSERDRNAQDLADAKLALNAEQARTRTAEANLGLIRDAQTSQDARFATAQRQIYELETRLNEQSPIDQDLALVSESSELRDLIAARNLHIIDVVDVDRHGVKKPFGRVFYTEGRSLLIYAYDLTNTKGNQTFYAWGHKEGDSAAPRPLGVLYKEDQDQRRWVFRFNDAKVLAQIDSIFVTLEPNDKPGVEPKGKMLLMAYLGTPANHP